MCYYQKSSYCYDISYIYIIIIYQELNDRSGKREAIILQARGNALLNLFIHMTNNFIYTRSGYSKRHNLHVDKTKVGQCIPILMHCLMHCYTDSMKKCISFNSLVKGLF